MNISLLQVPWDSGRFGKRMGKGPLHLVEQGLVKHLESKGNSVEFTECNLTNSFTTEAGAAKELNTTLAKTIHKVRKDEKFPIILSGNCNMSLGIITGLNLTEPGTIWFDAHADFNTPETTSSGFFDAMGLSILTGNSWETWRRTITGFTPVDEQNVVLIGARDFDVKEFELLKNSEIRFIPVPKVRNEEGSALSQALIMLSETCEELYIHLDLDVLDPSELKANQFYAENGLLLSELKNILYHICTNFKIAAISFTSYDPTFDKNNKGIHIVKSILDTVLPPISV